MKCFYVFYMNKIMFLQIWLYLLFKLRKYRIFNLVKMLVDVITTMRLMITLMKWLEAMKDSLISKKKNVIS